MYLVVCYILKNLIMKWSKFIQNESSSMQQTIKEINPLVPSNNISKDKQNPLSLKSIEKVKNQYKSLSKQNNLNNSFNSSESKYSHYKQMLHNKSINGLTKNQNSHGQNSFQYHLNAKESQEIVKIVNKFHQQLENILKNVAEIIKQQKFRKQYKEQIQIRIKTILQQTISTYLPHFKIFSYHKILQDQLGNHGASQVSLKLNKLKMSSKQISAQNISDSVSQFKLDSNNKKGGEKKYSKIMQFKRNKVNEKDGQIINNTNDLQYKNDGQGYEKAANAFEKIDKILETKRQAKIVRKSKLNKLDRSNSRFSRCSNGSSRSVDQILQTSQNSRIGHKSRLKGHDMMYNMSKLLNE